MQATFNFYDVLGGALTVIPTINGVAQPASNTYSATFADESSIVIALQAVGYRGYSNVFKTSIYDIIVDIVLIEEECDTISDQNCCSTSYSILDVACSDSKRLYKTSSSPGKFSVYLEQNNEWILYADDNTHTVFIDENDLCCDTTRVKITTTYKYGCCGGPELNCYKETIFSISKQRVLPEFDFEVETISVPNLVKPFIDFDQKKYYNPEYKNLVVGIENTFSFYLTYIYEYNIFVNNVLQNYTDNRGAILFTAQILDGETVLTQQVYTLVDAFLLADFTTFLEELATGFEYTFLEKGIFTLKMIFETPCQDYEKTYELVVRGPIEVNLLEDCQKYSIVSLNKGIYVKVEKLVDLDTWQKVYEVQQNPSTLQFNELYDIPANYWNLIYNAGESYYELQYIGKNTVPQGLLTVQDIVKIEDGIYRITVNDGTTEVVKMVLHLCQTKKCYRALLKARLCDEEIKKCEDPQLIKQQEKMTLKMAEFMGYYYQLHLFYTYYQGNLFDYTLLSQNVGSELQNDLITIFEIINAITKTCYSCTSNLDLSFVKDKNCGCS